ncbi:unnamed protein product [Rangifer tarandus platyrhynchus]|uniref:Uncharacterized protein n=1 Tax=Rangifer tarandus platyrhynchus TaxID=3082113 RepID=A0AC59Z187_RANTA
MSHCTCRHFLSPLAPHPRLAASPSLLCGLWLDTFSCPAGRSILATRTVPAAPPGRPEQADRQPSSTGGGGLPPYHPDNRCPRRYSSCRGRARSALERVVQPRPHRGGVVTPPPPPASQTDRQTHAYTLPPPRAFLQRAGLGRAHSGTVRPPPGPAVMGGNPRGGPGSGARPLGAREGKAGPRPPAPTSQERWRASPGRGSLAGSARGSGSPPRPCSYSCVTGPVPPPSTDSSAASCCGGYFPCTGRCWERSAL